MQSMSQRFLSLLMAVATMFLILTVSIGLPIYIRPFYYAHIEALDLPQRSGFTAEEIREAYDQVLDYLTIPGKEFGTGVIPHSPSGEAHFEDCRGLFFLNGGVLLASAMTLGVIGFLRKRKPALTLSIAGRSPAFFGALAALVVPLTVGVLAAADFDRAFTVFHTIFFPGKDNWVFNWNTDQIIRVLPQKFFMHCAMFIGGGVLSLSCGVMACEGWKNRKEKQWNKT